jgi:hypothetical protein
MMSFQKTLQLMKHAEQAKQQCNLASSEHQHVAIEESGNVHGE